MEILFELLNGLLNFLGEMLLQAIWQIVAEILGNACAAPFRRNGEAHPVLAGVGYVFYGGMVGLASFFLLPGSIALPRWLRIVNLIVAPIACGLVMAAFGNYKRSRGKDTIRMDSFWYGFLFALAMAGVRFLMQTGLVRL